MPSTHRKPTAVEKARVKVAYAREETPTWTPSHGLCSTGASGWMPLGRNAATTTATRAIGTTSAPRPGCRVQRSKTRYPTASIQP